MSSSFSVGQRVRHPSLGKGIIRSIRDNGKIAVSPWGRSKTPDIRLVIDFDDCGTRELLQAFAAARLEVLE